MNEEQIALARRAVACRGWRWLLGCRVVHIEYGNITTYGLGIYLGAGMQPGDMYIQWDDNAPRGLSASWSSPQNFRPEPHVYDYCVPVLDDPATLGCLLALVREARGEPTYLPTCLDVHDEAWVVRRPGPGRQTRYESYAAVLIAALEAAP